MKRPLIATLCAALAAGSLSVPAQADEMKIEYADLNLATAQGQAALEARIDRAAKEVCGYNDLRTGSRLSNREVTSCYEQAKKSATRQMATLIEEERLGG